VAALATCQRVNVYGRYGPPGNQGIHPPRMAVAWCRPGRALQNHVRSSGSRGRSAAGCCQWITLIRDRGRSSRRYLAGCRLVRRTDDPADTPPSRCRQPVAVRVFSRQRRRSDRLHDNHQYLS
jgi:hypothetical protein